MATSFVLTIIGTDQPGLVEAVAHEVAEQGGSWAESRMARLAGYFAGILEVSVPAERAPALRRALGALEARGLRVMVEEVPEGGVPPLHYTELKLELVGQDRPGIVRDISAGLAAIDVNVAELSTECTSAPMSGESLFHARALLHLPTSRSSDELRDALEKIAADLMVDIDIEEAAE
ncbi:MAG: ACT domain-containing protein [Myxococcota bacterium]|nr:ACT domain-containing protein [Myxococcota bacterium]